MTLATTPSCAGEASRQDATIAIAQSPSALRPLAFLAVLGGLAVRSVSAPSSQARASSPHTRRRRELEVG